MTGKQADVVIIGAGIAGLAAADELSRQGLDVIVLEARAHVGGRVWTLHPPSAQAPIELGAEFIHGKPPQLWELLKREGLNAQELTGEVWCRENGHLRRCDNLFGEVDKVFEAMEKTNADCSFADFLRIHGLEFSEKAKQWATSYVEGFHAADRNRISVHSLVKSNKADEEIDGDSQFRPVEGYDGLVQALLRRITSQRVRLLLKTRVRRVEWRPGQVSLLANSPDQTAERLTATQAIVTLPLGVLKAAPGSPGAVEFAPALQEKRRALERLEMGPVIRVSLYFKERFWTDRELIGNPEDTDLSNIGFLFAHQGAFPTWWTMVPRQAPLLTGWAAGPRAEALRGCSHDQIVDRALSVLASIFATDNAQLANLLEEGYTHDWQSDPFSLGAYSYALVGGAEAPRELAAPVQETLFFAGEATDFTGHHGTVHGALASGYRAAQEVMHARERQLAS